MNAADWIQTLLLVVTIVGLMITIFYNRRQLQIFNDQLKLNFFADYTKRYQQIMLHLPEDIIDDDFDYDVLSEEKRKTTLKHMRIYFNLCSEEYELWNNGYIEKRIWDNWKAGIEFAMTKKAFRDAWERTKQDAIYHEDFRKWIDSHGL
ncbi:MAG: hypothetical protein AAGI23_07770 [Bacteroidota bacterium]